MNPSPVFAQASWIASPIAGGKRTSAPAPYLRKLFRLDQPVRSAQLVVTALGLYECEINGRRVGDEIFAPGWTDYNKRVQYQTYDVTGLLRQGENVLGAILGDGWYCGYVAWHGRQNYGERPRLLARLEVIFQDGSTTVIATDSSWKTALGPILESDMLMGESYDARLDLGAWSQPGNDESRWQPVLVAPPDRPVELVPRLGPPVRRIGEIKPLKESRKATWNSKFRIFDLGQNFTGRIRISIRAPRGATLRIRYAEVLNPDGSLYTENLREARCTDYYTCRGEGTEAWEPLFTFHGFRYVDVQGLQPDDFLEVTGVVLHSDMAPTGTFRCSHEGLNQLQHNIVWGQKSNFLEVPTDCPQRDERLGWTGDAQVFIRTAAFNMDVREFFHKWMQDMRDCQGAEGGIPCVVPTIWVWGAEDLPGKDGGPAWADAEIICPWTIYLCYGDRKILADHYESMQRFMEFMAKNRCRGHIRAHPEAFEWQGFGDWLALDGGGKTEGITPVDLIGTAFYAHDADLMAKTADILGRPGDAKKYRILHGEIVDAFRRRFVTPEGLVVSGTQTSYVLALHFGLIEESTRATAVRELVRDIEKRNYHLATGFVGTPYLLDVLENAGRLDVAYKLLEQETFPSWLFPVRNGATTIWERWDGWTPEKGFQDKGMNSFNHYAYGAVGAWMYRTVAGLEPDPNEPGYAHIIFRPRPGGSITWAEASLQTALGLAAIRWDLDGDTLQVQLTVPPGAHATFQPPPGYAAKESTQLKGSHRLVLKKT
ncbi:MAG: glycoside hydrolase family 78 protein [Methylacidiphilales bacterium]|nr:glycoside hydrolase family 78 protein [Candidatus Methylacidiphilales bacterium]